MTAPELKPCPFCGCAMEITDDLRHYNHPMSACFGRHIGIAASDIDRIEMWNRRADIAAVQPAQGDYFEGLEEGIKIGRGEPQPDPRDEVIARLVDAATDANQALVDAAEEIAELRLAMSKQDLELPWIGDAIDKLTLSIAAAKAVQHG